ncbi:MAG: Flp family type IVb pilin [Hyphomicrobiales bacterium]|nr:MAG: Flp family type IVb pilin [Hyphomicrobiales bacterium]
MLGRFIRDETGATALEYALIVAILSALMVGGLGEVLHQIMAKFLFAANEIEVRTPNP